MTLSIASLISSEFDGLIFITPPKALEFPENSDIMIADVRNLYCHFLTAINSKGGIH